MEQVVSEMSEQRWRAGRRNRRVASETLKPLRSQAKVDFLEQKNSRVAWETSSPPHLSTQITRVTCCQLTLALWAMGRSKEARAQQAKIEKWRFSSFSSQKLKISCDSQTPREICHHMHIKHVANNMWKHCR